MTEPTSKEPITIHPGRAIQGLRWAVAQRGADFIYRVVADSCTYTRVNDDGDLCPDCGVGVALAHLGVPLAVLADADLSPGGSAVVTITLAGYELEPRTRAVFAAFQLRQDQGLEWGQALTAAELVWKLTTSSIGPNELVANYIEERTHQ